MSDDAPAADKGGKKGKKDKAGGKSNLVPAVVLAIGIAAGGYFMGGSSEPAAAGAEGTTTTAPLGEIATMDPISVNLADGHFLKVGLGVQLSETANAEEFPKGPMSKVKDLLISEVGGGDMVALSTNEGREELKKKLTEKAAEEFEGEVLGFYFTDFVMQ